MFLNLLYDQNELNFFWKLFSGNNDLKIIFPTNNILQQILEEEKFKMWYWINPNNNNTLDDYDREIKMKEKIFGLKFHMYWLFKIEKILKYHKLANYYKLPIYIILNYVDETDLNNFLHWTNFKKYYLVMAAFQCLIIVGKILLNTKLLYWFGNHIKVILFKKY